MGARGWGDNSDTRLARGVLGGTAEGVTAERRDCRRRDSRTTGLPDDGTPERRVEVGRFHRAVGQLRRRAGPTFGRSDVSAGPSSGSHAVKQSPALPPKTARGYYSRVSPMRGPRGSRPGRIHRTPRAHAVHAAGTLTRRPRRPRPPAPIVWPLWQRILFRFFFVYLALEIAPWNLFRVDPAGALARSGRYDTASIGWCTGAMRTCSTRGRRSCEPNGSGDTSWAFTEIKVFLSVAAAACVVWSVLDRKRANYTGSLFWLRMSVRYYVAAAALSYGIIKMFLLQMPFPTLSQLATPLGDLLPMRFSWLFIGFSAKYQFFSGSMEMLAGLLLLYRRTITAGLFAATGAFANVVMINMAYDVPVKLYSSHLLFCCLFLLALDAPRLIRFLVLNQPTPPTTAWDWISRVRGKSGESARSRHTSSGRCSLYARTTDGKDSSRCVIRPRPDRSRPACTTCVDTS